ncbi:MAG: outer membrane lipoprotein-sorting protein [Candidatus Rokubacteria bacterium]|nr:outer membrane lipoprotein-sorting protein [Candidatus Rokubacteria bacterium]
MRAYVEAIVRFRLIVIGLTVLATAFLALQVTNLRVVIDPNSNVPRQHPYVATTERIEKVFGARHVIVIGITPKAGDALTPHVLAKVQRITAALVATPGVMQGSLLSLSARRAKNIRGTAEGMEVLPLMETVPQTRTEIEALRAAVRANPVYLNTILSRDERTTAILAEFNEDQGGFRGMVEKVRPLVERERDASVEIVIGGFPVYLAEVEGYSQRMAFLFPLAVAIIGLIHYEAFRTIQGLILPLVTALLAVVWGLGIMGVAGVPMDAFNATTPILILAVAAGHAVQILKRYYEEYHRLQGDAALPPREANRLAVVESVTRIGPVMLTAGLVAALGFLSLVVFDIRTIRTFGVFTGLGILSALILEMTLIPALRSLLPAPGGEEGRRERERRVWDRITQAIAGWVTGPSRRRVFVVTGCLVAVCVGGASRVTIDNSTRALFFRSLPFQRDDRALNDRLGGTNSMFVLVEGDRPDAIKDPRVLRAMDATQRFLEQQPYVGKTLSLADFVRRMNRAMHGDDAAYDRIPESPELISQYLLLYSMSGEPGDFDSYVDYEYRSANLWVFLKTDSSAYIEELIAKLHAFPPAKVDSGVRVRIGGSVPQTSALNEAMVRGKILNIVQFGGVILVIASLVFRSPLAGLLVLAPLSLAVLANFGLMGLTGIRFDIATALISAMAVGIGADYAIYLIYRLREELGRGVDETAAVHAALSTAGKAILFVASAVAGGYGVLVFSYGFYVHMWFAILIASAMLVSAFGALIILPSLILTFRPRFVFGVTGGRAATGSAILGVVLLAAGLVATRGEALGAEPAPTEIMERNFTVTKVVDSVSQATFTLINKNGQERVRTTFTTTKLQPNGVDNMQMVRFLSPPDVKGTAILLIERSDRDDDIWVYLPALKKVRRLVASNKKDSFVGTDFSYGDVIGHRVQEWEHRLVGEQVVDGQACYLIESLPRRDAVKASSGYSKRRSWIRKDNFVMLKADYWDLAAQPLKTIRSTGLQLVDPARQKWQPMRLESMNIQTGHRTVIQYETFKANQQVKDEFFTTRYMEREP